MVLMTRLVPSEPALVIPVCRNAGISGHHVSTVAARRFSSGRSAHRRIGGRTGTADRGPAPGPGGSGRWQAGPGGIRRGFRATTSLTAPGSVGGSRYVAAHGRCPSLRLVVATVAHGRPRRARPAGRPRGGTAAAPWPTVSTSGARRAKVCPGGRRGETSRGEVIKGALPPTR